MNINLYTFSKRENSTARPSGTGTVFSCYLKESTSVVDPVIILDHADENNPQMHYFNYAYVAEFGRYYFVTDIQLIGHLWQYTLSTDIMATYKDDISSATLYLLRCSSEYDGDIRDDFYPVKNSYTEDIQSALTPWIHVANSENINITDGCFILGIAAMPAGSGYSNFGSIKYVVLDRDNLIQLITYLLTDGTMSSNGFNASEMSIALQKSIVDPISFIKSCQWCPMLYSDFGNVELQDLNIWSWTATGVKYKYPQINPPYYIWNVTFSLTDHPEASSRGDYLNAMPFTKRTVLIPPFGAFEIDTSIAAKASQVRGQIIYDVVTGSGILDVFIDNQLITRVKSQIGVPIQMTQVYNDYINAGLNMAGGLAGGIASALTGNIAGVISSGISMIGSAVDAMRPVQSSTGGNGGFSDLRGQAKLYSIFYDPVDEDVAHHGRPLCQNKLMSGISAGSYCLAMDGDVSISGTAGEQASLKAYLEGGFYYE